jgi:hypothetical protein
MNKYNLIMTNIVVNQLYELAKSSLEREMYINAVFYAERLITECDKEEFRLVLAKAYIGILY